MRLQCNILLHEGTHHVGVVPVSWASICNNDVLVVPIVVDSSLHGVPGILNIIEIPPEIACVDNAGVVGLKTNIFFFRFFSGRFFLPSFHCRFDRPARNRRISWACLSDWASTRTQGSPCPCRWGENSNRPTWHSPRPKTQKCQHLPNNDHKIKTAVCHQISLLNVLECPGSPRMCSSRNLRKCQIWVLLNGRILQGLLFH